MGLEVNTHLSQILDFYIYNLVWQTELGDTVLQHTTDFVQCLKYIYVITFLHHIASKAQSGRTRTYYGNLHAVGWCNLGQTDVAALALKVSCETLQVADGYSGLVHLQVDTLALALLLLRTNTSAHSGQGRGVLQHLSSSQELSALDVLDERWDVDVYRTTLNTSWLGAVQAALSFGHRHLLGQSDVHLLGTCGSTINGVELRHNHALNLSALFWFHALSELITPSSIAVGQHLDGIVGRIAVHLDVGTFSLGFLLSVHAVKMLLVVGQLLLLFALKGAHTLKHLVPVNQSTIKFRTVDTNKLGLASDSESACATHTCSVNHNGVQANFARNVVLLSGEVREFHHDWRSDGEYLIHVWLLLNEFLDTNGYYALLAVATVIGHNDYFVRTFAYLILKDNQVL